MSLASSGERFDVLGDGVAVAARHAEVGEHDLRALAVDGVDGQIAVADGDDLDAFALKRQRDDPLHGDAVVSEQELWHHGNRSLTAHPSRVKRSHVERASRQAARCACQPDISSQPG